MVGRIEKFRIARKPHSMSQHPGVAEQTQRRPR